PSEAEPLLHMQLPGRHRPTPVDGGGRELKAQRWIALLRRDDQAEVCRGDRVIAPLAAESAEVPIDCEDGQLHLSAASCRLSEGDGPGGGPAIRVTGPTGQTETRFRVNWLGRD